MAMEYVYAPLFPTTTLKVEKHVWFIYSFLTLLCVWSSIGQIFDFCNNQWFWLFKYLKVRKLTVSSLQKIKMKIINLLQLFQNLPSNKQQVS